MESDLRWRAFNDMIHKIVKAVGKKSAAQMEAFFTSSRTTEVTIRNSEILAQNRTHDSGVGFRAVAEGNRIGFACTNSLRDETLSQTAEKALSIAKVGSPVPDFQLPETRKPSNVSGLFFPEIAEINVEEAVNFAQRAIDSAEGFDKRVIVKSGRIVFQSGWRGTVNTQGVDCEEKESRAIAYLDGVGEEDGQVTGSCFELALSRRSNLNPENVGEKVGRMVTEMFDPKPLKSFEGTVIFGPQAVSYQLCDALVDALKGENVLAGRSAWSGRSGQTVASEDLSIQDNAILDGGFSSRGFDDEGFPSQRTILVEDGTLRSYLHQASTAKALKTSNTGNASRFSGSFDMVHMIVGNGYRTKPEVYPSNLVIEPGNKSREELVSETNEGVLVEAMAGFAQRGSGIISAQLSRAFYVRNGEVLHPIKGSMVSGNAFDWLKQVSGVGNDVKAFMNAIVPSLRVEDVRVVGA